MSRATSGLYISETFSTLTLNGGNTNDLSITGGASVGGALTTTGNTVGNIVGFVFDNSKNIVVGTQKAAITKLTGTPGTANGAIITVTNSGDDSTINGNFQDLMNKVNLIIDRLGATVGHGLTAD